MFRRNADAGYIGKVRNTARDLYV